jgi:menaquinol-cytochrome c reductase iron-sulfur subunit
MSEDKKDDINISRRKFLKTSSISIIVVSSGLLGIPFLNSIIDPVLKKTAVPYSKVGSLESLPTGQPVNIPFLTSSKDAYLNNTEMHNLWVIKNTNDTVTAFSPICPHLGCSYNWNASSNHFECPCHGSVFDLNGKVLAGPSPRGLDTLPIKIKDNVIYVEWETYRVGEAKKIIS